MDAPFIYDKFVTGKNFIGRKSDCTILGNLISQHENIVLYAPPKGGKTSLVQQALFNLRVMGKQLRIGQFSALNIRSVEAFLLRLGGTALRAVATTPSEYAALADRHLGGTHVIFDPGHFADSDEVLSTNWALDREDWLAVLRLPYRIARDGGAPLLLIIDEFQNLALTEDGDGLFKAMEQVMKEELESGRAPFSYIFSGSMVNAMKDIFEVRRFFYRQVEPLKMQPVDEREITEHIAKGFLTSGKVIDKDLLLGACRLFRNNLWYINHFVSICDSKSKGYIMEPILVEALAGILAIHEPRFRSMVNDLTTHQVSLLRATIDGCTKFSSSEVVRAYALNSSANVKRVKDALVKKEIVTFDSNDIPTILDPLFEYWVRKYYFEKKDA